MSSGSAPVVNLAAGEHIGRLSEGFSKVHAGPVDGEPANLLGVLASAHLQHHESAVHRVLLLNVAEQDDRIRERRNVLLAGAFAANQ